MTNSTAPLFGLLLDVDGPIASPLTRSVAIPSIATDLANLANAGVPIVFNTGRSDAFIRSVVVPPLLAAGLAEHARVHAICEKGASWFTITPAGGGDVEVDHALATPEEYGVAIEKLVSDSYSEWMFFDHTKRAMISIEQHIDVDSAEYLDVQPRFDVEAIRELTARGYGVTREGTDHPDANGDIQYRVDPSIISTDIESIKLGKDLGASRALALLEGTGELPVQWRTVGDSRGDYAMADWLAERGYSVAHVDVRPKDGIPDRDYPVLTAGELIHDEAGAAFLSRWWDMLSDPELTESGVGETASA